MGMLKDFKDFAMRGNVVDMAVGIIIGAAFGKVVSSFVKDVVMPPIGKLTGGVNFEDLKIVVQEAAPTADPPVAEVAMQIGAFINTVIDFVIVAFVIFIAIKVMTSMKKKEEEAPAAPPEPSKEEKLLAEIRDILAAK